MRQIFYAVFLTLSILGACSNKPKPGVLGYEGIDKVDQMKFPTAPSKNEAISENKVLDDAYSAEKPIANESIRDKSTEVASVEKKIIKEGSITFETNNLKATRKLIIDSLQKLGGYIGEEHEENNEDIQRKEYTLSTRIPAQNFERFLSTVSTSADHIESKTITVKDVTTEFIDVTTRLNNQKLLENRYKELLQKSTRMADVLEVENKLNDIRTNIESTQGQLNYLSKQIAYSSLEITFFVNTSAKGTDEDGFGYKFKKSLRNSWQILENIFFGTITLWPVILLIIAMVWLVNLWWKRRKKRKEIIPE